jgi:hypothetical protein
MIQVGDRFEIPEFRLAELKNDLVSVADWCRGEPFDTPTANFDLATVLHYNGPDNGQYHKKIAAFYKYRLFERVSFRRTAISDLGKRLLSTDTEEMEEAWRQTITNIHLWSEFYHTFQLNTPDWTKEKAEGFPEFRKITSCTVSEAKKIALDVYDAYDDDTKVLRASQPNQQTIEIKAGPFVGGPWLFTEKSKRLALKWLRKIKVPASHPSSDQ